MKKRIMVSLLLFFIFNSLQLFAQTKRKTPQHELAPFLGLYAPDRFGTRVMYTRNINLRYEIMAYIFRSGIENTAWTNSNVEIAFALGFYL
ncbi:MAG: hypothetical protein ACE5I1_14535 [bacterium]